MEGYSGDGGQATAAELYDPEGVAVDHNGNLFIACTADYRIREVNLSTGIITTVAGNGIQGYSGDGGQATAARLNHPRGIAAENGNLFIADDWNNRVREVNLTTGIITTVAGKGTGGFSGDGGQATVAEIWEPWGVAVDNNGNLFIADVNNYRVREVKLSTGIITTVAGNGIQGYSGDGGQATAAELNCWPFGIAVDNSGHLYIADANNYRVRQVNLSTGVITTVAGNGIQGYSGDGGQATIAEFNGASAVAVDATGNLFIADVGNYRVREVNKITGVISTVVGNGTEGYAGDGGQAAAAGLDSQVGIVTDAVGNLFIGEYDGRVREINASTGVITTVAGNGTWGSSGDGGQATAAQLYLPVQLAVDGSGHLFIYDDHSVREVNLSTGIISTLSALSALPWYAGIYAIAADNAGNLFIAVGKGIIWEYNLSTGASTKFATDSDFQSMAADSRGHLFFCGDGLVRELNLSTGVITTVAGGGSVLGDGGQATAAELEEPLGIAVDAAGNSLSRTTATCGFGRSTLLRA